MAGGRAAPAGPVGRSALVSARPAG